MVFAKPAIVLSTLLLIQPAAAQPNYAELGGIIAGEVVCSLSRQGHSAQVLAKELDRVTTKLLAKGLLKASEEDAYLEAARAVFQECP